MIDQLMRGGANMELLKLLDQRDRMSAASTNARNAMEAFPFDEILKVLGMVLKIVGLISG